MRDLSIITGQKPIATKAKKSIAGFKIREGQEIGCKVTLRAGKMYDFAYSDMSLKEDATQVTLKSKEGATFVINIEQHIHNELMDYAVQQKAIIDNNV